MGTERRAKSTGMGERLKWCQDARPIDWRVQKRVVSASSQKCVLWVLTNRSNADGSSYSGQDLIAAESGLGSRQTVNAALQALAEQDWISIGIDPEARRSRRYVLNLSHVATEVEEGPVAGGDVSPDQGVRVAGNDVPHVATAPVASRDTDLSHVATPIEPLDRTGSEPRSSARKPNEAFDALALATGWDPRALTPSAGGEIGKKLSEIRIAETSRLDGEPSPSALVDEIYRRARRYRQLHTDWALTPSTLAKYWPELGATVQVPRVPHAVVPAVDPVPPPWIAEGISLADYRRRIRRDRDDAAAAHARAAAEDAEESTPAAGVSA